MKRTLFIGCLSFFNGCLLGIIILFCKYSPLIKQNQTYKTNDIISEKRIKEVQYIENEEELDQLDVMSKKIQKELKDIESIDDKEKWFISYNNIVDEYSTWFDPPETVFDVYTEEELYLIFRVVETECYDADFISKCNVASVIFNRIESGEFGDSVKEVITSPNQFSYCRENITESTILSVMYAYEIEDTTNGCVAFRSDQCPMKWCDWEYVFTDEAGHNFYK